MVSCRYDDADDRSERILAVLFEAAVTAGSELPDDKDNDGENLDASELVKLGTGDFIESGLYTGALSE
jgi:hypothetical protein